LGLRSLSGAPRIGIRVGVAVNVRAQMVSRFVVAVEFKCGTCLSAISEHRHMPHSCSYSQFTKSELLFMYIILLTLRALALHCCRINYFLCLKNNPGYYKPWFDFLQLPWMLVCAERRLDFSIRECPMNPDVSVTPTLC
jgi:hypothetical protein